MKATLPMSAVVAVLGALLLAVRSLQARGWIGAEAGRKLVHAGMGTVALPFPWIFRDTWPVWTLAVIAAVILGSIRSVPTLSRRYGSILGGVERSSLGDLLFPLGAALAFQLAGRDRAAYCAAIGVLAFADTAGALVGTRWGRLRYAVAGGHKTLEGSLAVLFVSALCGAAGYYVLGRSLPGEAVLGGLAVGAAAAAVEAVAGFGLDNLFMPTAVVAIMVHWHP